MTASMEDYLEMIYRLSRDKGYTRMRDLAAALNVQPPAATRMVQKLAAMKLINYQKYGILELEELGKKIGASLLLRHNTVERFLRTIGVKESELLEETEKIEHTLGTDTLSCISCFLKFIENSDWFRSEYNRYISNNHPG